MAGALGLRLAGPRVYDGVVVDDHWMGDGRAEATPQDIDRALTLYRTAVRGHAAICRALIVLAGQRARLSSLSTSRCASRCAASASSVCSTSSS